jgi:hydrocephalus-inducing protein
MATFDVDCWSSVIEPRQKQVVNVSLKSEILGIIHVDLRVKLEGHAIPVLIQLNADSIGPIVEVDREDIDYGNVEVLRDYTEKIRIKNQSRIDAEFTAFTKNKESIWKVVQRHGILKPDEEKVVDVVCNADEVQKF